MTNTPKNPSGGIENLTPSIAARVTALAWVINREIEEKDRAREIEIEQPIASAPEKIFHRLLRRAVAGDTEPQEISSPEIEQLQNARLVLDAVVAVLPGASEERDPYNETFLVAFPHGKADKIAGSEIMIGASEHDSIVTLALPPEPDVPNTGIEVYSIHSTGVKLHDHTMPKADTPLLDTAQCQRIVDRLQPFIA